MIKFFLYFITDTDACISFSTHLSSSEARCIKVSHDFTTVIINSSESKQYWDKTNMPLTTSSTLFDDFWNDYNMSRNEKRCCPRFCWLCIQRNSIMGLRNHCWFVAKHPNHVKVPYVSTYLLIYVLYTSTTMQRFTIAFDIYNDMIHRMQFVKPISFTTIPWDAFPMRYNTINYYDALHCNNIWSYWFDVLCCNTILHYMLQFHYY